MHSFRRQAAQETRNDRSGAEARQLLNHILSSKAAFIHYDPHGYGRRDTTALRLGTVALSLVDVRKHFSAASQLAANGDKPSSSLKSEIDAQASYLVAADPKYQQLEDTLHHILTEANKVLQEHGYVAANDSYTLNGNNIAKYWTLLGEHPDEKIVAMRTTLDEHLAARKVGRVGIVCRIKTKLRKEIEAAAKDGANMGSRTTNTAVIENAVVPSLE